MAGYTRQSAAQIVNGEIVSAPPLNAEFNQVLAAFNASTGHRHDGTANEGPLIALIADPSRHNEVLINTSLNQIPKKLYIPQPNIMPDTPSAIVCCLTNKVAIAIVAIKT